MGLEQSGPRHYPKTSLTPCWMLLTTAHGLPLQPSQSIVCPSIKCQLLVEQDPGHTHVQSCTGYADQGPCWSKAKLRRMPPNP